MRIGSLFSGAGGLDLAVEAVFGGRTVWHCEVDPAASKVLAARWPGVPNLGDITAVDWTAVEPVDVLCGGFPCQDVSAAGRRAGIRAGSRSGLWAMFAGAIAALKPPIVVIENVRGLLSARAHRAMESAEATVGDGPDGPVLRALGAVLGDLSDIGYDAQWATVAASDVGAPHRRERVFIVAADAARDARWLNDGDKLFARSRSGQQQPAAGRSDLADAARDGRHEGWPKSAGQQRRSDAALSSDGPVDLLLPTPCAQNSGNTPENHLAKKPGRQQVTDLAILVENGLLHTGGKLLPTPAVNDMGEGKTPDWWDEWTAKAKTKHDLPSALLPTPEAKNAHAGPDYARMNRDGSGGHDLVTAIAHDGVTESQWGKYAAAIRRWEQITRPAPPPTEPNSKGNPRLSAAFAEWMMGWPEGWVTDPAVGLTRNEQLARIGNGVVTLQAIAAIRHLLAVSEIAA
ncbi:hypothetical protein A9W98_17935 [Mycobacterium gordonae]|uniref:DNA (cytosine-5-)-methyltransferase n=1 Tax=Mycobacterium gordonae TaxID=1778 RepID=A0A1A6BI14_MYCGO|nr:DNA cytosine methyltransferase [Mycobacterium gordonae]OBS01864.1 hypothetical protein A9W98_17935 [Mycobacterium gordonae]